MPHATRLIFNILITTTTALLFEFYKSYDIDHVLRWAITVNSYRER